MDSQIRFKEKSVIIHRDENGFGLRVSGQNPVFVDCVHDNGAAWKAGVRKNDRIIKVNGTLVRSYDHKLVVQMIQHCTPFVNLTLHSPEQSDCSVSSGHPYTLGVDQNNGNIIAVGNSQISQTNNMRVHPHNHHNYPSTSLQLNATRRQPNPHPLQGNLDWLLEIGDDLFQDNQQKQSMQHQQSQQEQLISVSQQPIVSGVSKLIVSGPNPLSHSSSNASSSKHNKSHSNNNNTRDNPYYYYKTAQHQPDKSFNDTLTPNTNTSNVSNVATSTSTSSLLGDTENTSTKANSSMIRSRSSSKMSTRSTTSKYAKARNLRTRLVEDLRSLAITNSQTTPSSLSTSPSSSDLSDCDDLDQHGGRIDCGLSNLSQSPNSVNTIMIGGIGAATVAGFNLTSPLLQQQQNQQHGNNKSIRLTTRRLEIIRELVDTEKTHTEKLKQLNDLLYKPIKAENLVTPEQLKMVFSCHKKLFKIHRQIYKKLLAAQVNYSEQPQHQQQYLQEPLVGKALIDIFEGELGRRLEKAASSFCACQSTNTDLLNRITRKDTKTGEFLAQVANQQMLGRLGIKDLLASCFQRLTKYPLLLDNLLKATPNLNGPGVDSQLSAPMIHSKSLSEGCIAMPATNNTSEPTENHYESIEHDGSEPPSNDTTISSAITTSLSDEYAYERFCIERALQSSRQILIHVNEAVNRAIAHNKLKEIWKKTDKNPSLPQIDIDSQQLLHEGSLTLRQNRRQFEVYVLLLTHYLVILTRDSQDKYKLKPFPSEGKLPPQNPNQLSPIFNIDEHLVTRDSATDENGFYLLCKHKDDQRIYELASQSPLERARWKEKIHMAQLHNFAVVPDDDNTLTRYTELISLNNSDNTPNNIEHSLTGSLAIANLSSSVSSNQSASTTATIVSSASLLGITQQQAGDYHKAPTSVNKLDDKS